MLPPEPLRQALTSRERLGLALLAAFVAVVLVGFASMLPGCTSARDKMAACKTTCAPRGVQSWYGGDALTLDRCECEAAR